MFLPDDYVPVKHAAWLVARWGERKVLPDRLAVDGLDAARQVIGQKLRGGQLSALAWMASGSLIQLPATFWGILCGFENLWDGEISFPAEYGAPSVQLVVHAHDLMHAVGVVLADGADSAPGNATSRPQPPFTLKVGPGPGAVVQALLDHQLDALGLPRGRPKPRPRVTLATPEEVEAFQARELQRMAEQRATQPRPPFIPSGHLWITEAISKAADLYIVPAQAAPDPDPNVPAGKFDQEFARWATGAIKEVERRTDTACRILLQALGDGALVTSGLSDQDGGIAEQDPGFWRTRAGQEALKQGYITTSLNADDPRRVWIMVREADLVELLLGQFGDEPPGWLGEEKARRAVPEPRQPECASAPEQPKVDPVEASGSGKDAAERWMRENVTEPGRMRDVTIKECQRKAGVTYRNARAAWNSMPAEFRGRVGANK